MELAAHRYDHRLLDVGYGSMLLWLRPIFAVLSDAEGTAWLTPTDLAAEPDPFCRLSSSPPSCIGWPDAPASPSDSARRVPTASAGPERVRR